MRFFLLVVLLVALALTIAHLQRSEKYCSGISYYKGLGWHGKVIAKYLDSLNHGYETILVREKYGVNTVRFITDTSKVYQLIAVGDSVEKARDSLAVYITAHGARKRHALKYICN